MAAPLLASILGGAFKTANVMQTAGGAAMSPLNAGATGVAKYGGKAAGFAQEAISSSKKKAMEQAIISGPVKLVKGTGKLTKSMAGKAGIQFGIAGILKQSQLFTGFVGALFQILGAFIDVLIAPLMPIMFKALTWVAKGIPYVQKGMAKLTEWIGIGWQATKKFFGKIFGAIGGFFKDAWENVKSKDFWLDLLKSAALFPWKLFKSYINLIWTIIKGYVKIWMFVFDKIWGVIKFIGNGIKLGWDWAQGLIGNLITKVKTMLGNLLDNILLMLLKGLDKSRFFNLSDQIATTQDRIAKRNAGNNQSTVKIQIESGGSLMDEFDTQANREKEIRVDQRYFQGMEYEVGAYNTFR